MLHMLLCVYTHVLSICFKCLGCFRLMLQVFHLDVAKVDLDIAYVSMAMHTRFKRMFNLFQTYVASVFI
jgi:hypothetical protein